MARANWRWLSAVRRALARSSCTSAANLDVIKANTTAIYNPVSAAEEAEAPAVKDSAGYYSSKEEAEEAEEAEEEEVGAVYKETFSREELAAITIQAHFRAHLARRAFRALKSLVRLQAVVRGACVRRQARIAIHCMQALVRLQVRVRARQLIAERSGGHRADN